MLTNKPLTTKEATEMIAQLEYIADRLFLAGRTFSGNQIQEIVYHLEANLEEEAEA